MAHGNQGNQGNQGQGNQGNQGNKKVPVLALIGDRVHNADYIHTHLNRLFAEMNLGFHYTIAYEEFQNKKAILDRLANYKVFLGFRDGTNYPGGYVGPDAWPYTTSMMAPQAPLVNKPWVTDAFGQAVKEWVAGGGGLFAAHNNCHVALYSKDYREVAGGMYDGHPPMRPWKVLVKREQAQHPIMRGVTDYIVTDEQHFTLYDGDPKYILMEGENIDGIPYVTDTGRRLARSTQAWAFPYGRGRVVHNSVGHNLDALWKPQTLTFWSNAIRWLLREI
ncbi:ThuA domain-containing protein [Dactylosporangium sp. NPDC051484]|uniref:ThuA domain-containing protein n=1 Tax=Dactylosporangium sp. NPDC051484 TaxID=3154942 RepID=UPI00344B650B